MIVPDPPVRDELRPLLDLDTSRLGDVYRRADMSPPEIARDLGVGSPNFVSNNKTIIRCLLEGTLPGRPAIAAQVDSKVRRLRRSAALSRSSRRAAPRREPLRGRPTPRVGSLRHQVEDELRNRARTLVADLDAQTDIDGEEYWSVVTADSPLDQLGSIAGKGPAGTTFKALNKADRTDLSLEARIIEWARDLPLTADVVDAARARLDYYERR